MLFPPKRYPSPGFVVKTPSSLMGGGVVSVELKPPRSSDIPDAVGEADERSESPVAGISQSEGSWFMVTRTEAASSSWTCWCLEMSSLEV